jgi:hypothetical protein
MAMTKDRKVSPFRGDYASTLEILNTELFNISYTDVFLQAAFAPADIRLDGYPRSNAKPPTHPGVILTVETQKDGTLQFPCDRFNDWKSNLRAIALGLEALRKLERYGITSARREQYRGFTALPAPEQPAEDEDFTFAGTAEAAHFIICHSGPGLERTFSIEHAYGAAYRAAVKIHHTDRPNSTAADEVIMRKLNIARAMLEPFVIGAVK